VSIPIEDQIVLERRARRSDVRALRKLRERGDRMRDDDYDEKLIEILLDEYMISYVLMSGLERNMVVGAWV